VGWIHTAVGYDQRQGFLNTGIPRKYRIAGSVPDHRNKRVTRIFRFSSAYKNYVYTVTCWGPLERFWAQIVQVMPLRTPFCLLIPFIPISITRSYNHIRLFLILLHVTLWALFSLETGSRLTNLTLLVSGLR
jgi:hypothetical protein